jgi:mediator of RNA polymerase II transcription subunit 13
MGAASERSRSLEAAASVVAIEVVENPLWAESWKTSVIGIGSVGGVWSTDVKAVQQLLGCIPDLEAPLTVGEVFGLADTVSNSTVIADNSTLQPMEAPMISIGKGEAVIQVLPPALRFWEKLGLSPKGGRKNVTAFVLFEENAERQSFMEKWLVGFTTTYQVRSMIPSDGQK